MQFNKKRVLFISLFICLFLVLSLNLTYSKFTYNKELSGSLVTAKPPTFVDTIAENSMLDTNIDFKLQASSTNGEGIMLRNGTQNDEYPIYYFRGNVGNNNVVFANFCWLIVRTTETGGIKIVYNGPVNDDGSCNNYSGVEKGSINTDNYIDAYINSDDGVYFYNMDGYNGFSPVYAGYMNNNENYLSISSPDGFVFTYTLDITNYLSHLSDNSIDSKTGRHVQNLYDSDIKTVIDAWYKTNIKGKSYESLIEDAVWCNDRSVISETYSIENYNTNGRFDFAAYTRLYENLEATPSLACSRIIDRFTVDGENGNGDLIYPIGMLTADEIVLSGIVSQKNWVSGYYNYLYIIGSYKEYGSFWSMSPMNVSACPSIADFFDHYLSSGCGGRTGARPAIVLNKDIKISSGDGTFAKPYVIST